MHAAGLGYTPLPGLGGHRRPRPDSPNTGWRNRSFRGYADYMQTSEFVAGLTELLALAGEARVAIMCAEALPWRCHRSLIADALMVRGVRVVDLLNRTSAREHRLTSFARATGAHLVYPAIEGAPGANGASIGPDPPPPPACGPIVAAGLLSRRGVS